MATKYPKPKGEFYCPFCRNNVTDKDLMWHEGLGGNWLHAACFLDWQQKRDATINDKSMKNIQAYIDEA